MHPLIAAARGASYTMGMSALALGQAALGSDPAVIPQLTQAWADGMCRRLNIDVHASGVDQVDWTRPYVIMSNHQSYLDVLSIYKALPRPFGMLAKRELFYVPVFSGVMRSLGCISIDRKSGSDSHRSLQVAAQQVREGNSIVVFPEGTRSAGDRILPLKKGPFYLVQEARVPIVPIGVRGSARLMPREGWGIRPGTIEVHVGKPIPVEGNGGAEERTAISNEVRKRLAELTDLPFANDE